MPSSITHLLIAEEASARLPQAVRTLAEVYPDAYLLGAQGPDPLFFARAAKDGRNMGRFLHRNQVYPLFCAFSEYLRSAPEPLRGAATAYCLGYVTHYCADTAFHPFVYRFLAQNRLRKREHQRIENDWDVYFARKLRGREAENFAFPPVRALADKLAPLWTDAAEQIGIPLSEKAFGDALRRFEKFLRFFHRRCYSAQRRWAAFDGLFRVRGLSCLYPAREPDAKILRGDAFRRAAEGDGGTPAADADELFERAVSRSCYRMLLFYDSLGGAALPREEFDRHLLNGTHTEP